MFSTTQLSALRLLLLISACNGSFTLEPLFSFEAHNSAAAQDKDNSVALFVVSVDQQFGFIDASGQIKIKPQFEKAFQFQDGLAAVQLEGKWGFINTKGELVVPPKFTSVKSFSEGLAAVREKSFSDPWKYIDVNGKVAIDGSFDVADGFRSGIARVGIQDRSGLNLLKAVLVDAGPEVNYYYIDKQGRTIPDPKPQDFATGTAGELIVFENNGLFGYVDTDGKVVIAPQFAQAGTFANGLAFARKPEDDLVGFIDRTGAFAIAPQFSYANDFAQGLAAVRTAGTNDWRFIDTKGETVIEPKFAWVYGGFRDGLAEVVLNQKAGYIDQTGKWIWRPTR